MLFIANFILLPLYFVFFVFSCFAALLPIYPSRVAKKNFKNQLNYAQLKATWCTALVYLNYSFYFVEVFILYPLSLTHVFNTKNFQEFLKRVGSRKKGNKGFVVLGSHLANIEEAGALMAREVEMFSKSTFVCLAKPARTRLMTVFLDWYRKTRKIGLLWTNRKDLVKELFRHSKNGSSLGFLVDQKPDAGGIYAKFFNDFAAFPNAGIEVPLRENLPVIFLTVRRLMPGLFYCYYSEASLNEGVDVEVGELVFCSAEILKTAASAKNDSNAYLMAQYCGWLEAVIRVAPTQWCWDYDKWSRQPKINLN